MVEEEERVARVTPQAVWDVIGRAISSSGSATWCSVQIIWANTLATKYQG